MLPTSAAGAALPAKPGLDTQVSQTQTTQPLSASRGEDAAALPPETAVAVDPPKQGGATDGLPQDQSNEAARLTEPSRLAPEVLARQPDIPDAKTPAGPPPTFDWSMLEKARALATSAPAPEASEPPPQTAPALTPSEATPEPQVAAPPVNELPAAEPKIAEPQPKQPVPAGTDTTAQTSEAPEAATTATEVPTQLPSFAEGEAR